MEKETKNRSQTSITSMNKRTNKSDWTGTRALAKDEKSRESKFRSFYVRLESVPPTPLRTLRGLKVEPYTCKYLKGTHGSNFCGFREVENYVQASDGNQSVCTCRMKY